VSRERAVRRAVREAERARLAAIVARRERRRTRRRELLRRLTPRRRRRAWLLGRRSPGQRALIIGLALAGLALIWYLVDPLALRIAFSLMLLLLLPVLAVVTFDRRL
jgi:Flp pilus assembly protein TadB